MKPMAGGGPIVLDMTALQFMDSTGVRLVAKAAMALEKVGWCLYVHTEDGAPSKVLEITGLGTAPNIHIVNHPGAHTPAPAPA